MRGTKLGVHGIYANDIVTFVRKLANNGTRFPVVKAVDDLGWLAEVRRLSPETVTIGRFTSGLEGCGDVMDGDLEQMAEGLVGVILRKMGTHTPDYWEVCNEPDPPGPDGYRRLSHLMIECMRVAERHGLKLGLFGLNAGTPEWDEMLAMAETGVFACAKEGGHILTLHEGTFSTQDPKQHWGDAIPGSPEVEGAGPLNFRYRYLYRLLEQRGEVVPLVVSEWYCGDEQSATPAELVQAVSWYDREMRKDPYAWAFCPFTLGPTSSWSHTDYERVYDPGLVSYAILIKDRENAEAPIESKPSDYERTYILLPENAGSEWFQAAAIGAHEQRRTIGYSAQDAGIGVLSDKTVVAVNPDQIGTGLVQDWYDEHYPGTEMETIRAGSPAELAVFLQGDMDGDIALSQQDAAWRDNALGEDPHLGTIGQYGCLLTNLAIMLRKLTLLDVTPDLLDRVFVIVRTAYLKGNLMDWEGIVDMFPTLFTGVIKDYRTRTESEYAALLETHEVILKYAERQHFVYLESVGGEKLNIIDPWDGERKTIYPSAFAGVRAAKRATPQQQEPEPSRDLLVGLHDEAGGEWMAEQRLGGCCLAHYQVQRDPVVVDLRHLQDAGITTICRLNWGYADGTGTFPRPADRDAFTSAVVSTILSGKGVDYWHVGNEPNNRQEWPGFGGTDEYPLTPEYVIEIYNEIWTAVKAHDGTVKLGPPPLDPYFGPGSNNMDWWHLFLVDIYGADAFFFHLKTQDNNPESVWSEAKFSDEPLTWQYLNMRAGQTYAEKLPRHYWDRPIFVTECNPQHKGVTLGWLPDNTEWVRKAHEFCRLNEYAGVVFYRYELAGDQAAFGLADKPALLEAIAEVT